jgi:lipopolysaccharide export system protein LptC
MSWRGILTLMLLIGALLSGWALWQQRQPKPLTQADSGRPDYVLHDFELTALDSEGKESFTVRAPNLVRRAGDESMTLDTPLFLMPNGENKHWEIRATKGWVSADQNELRLTGAVKANSPPEDLRPTTMNTEQLSVFPRQNRATSEQLVTLIRPGLIMTGVGMRANLKTRQIQLRSRVEAKLSPQ